MSKANEHRTTCADCSRPSPADYGREQWFATAPMVPSRALQTLPVGSVAVVGRGGRPVTKNGFDYDIDTDICRNDAPLVLVAFILCSKKTRPPLFFTRHRPRARKRPDGHWIVRAWMAADRLQAAKGA